MIVVTGFGLSSWIFARIGAPQPGFFVSTTVMPFDWTKTVVLPPPPRPQDEQVVLELLDLDDHRLLAALLRDDVRDRAGGDQGREHYDAFHTAPPEKKTRCTNQNTPASITMMEPANTSRRPAASLRDRIHTNSDATSTTNTSWPISTPTLNAKSVQPSARLGKSISRSTFAKPNPWIRPNAKAIQARVSRPRR